MTDWLVWSLFCAVFLQINLSWNITLHPVWPLKYVERKTQKNKLKQHWSKACCFAFSVLNTACLLLLLWIAGSNASDVCRFVRISHHKVGHVQSGWENNGGGDWTTKERSSGCCYKKTLSKRQNIFTELEISFNEVVRNALRQWQLKHRCSDVCVDFSEQPVIAHIHKRAQTLSYELLYLSVKQWCSGCGHPSLSGVQVSPSQNYVIPHRFSFLPFFSSQWVTPNVRCLRNAVTK